MGKKELRTKCLEAARKADVQVEDGRGYLRTAFKIAGYDIEIAVADESVEAFVVGDNELLNVASYIEEVIADSDIFDRIAAAEQDDAQEQVSWAKGQVWMECNLMPCMW